jgi:hypothetical protein
MATILTFRTAEFRTNEGTDRRASVSAEVILFPGIRYERWGDAETGASTSASANDGRANHDVLELAE